MTCNFDCFSPLDPYYSDMMQAVYVATGSSMDCQIPFDYLDKASFDGTNSRYLRAFVGGEKDDVSERTDYTMPDAVTVRLTGLVSGQFILIRADHKPQELLVDFADPNVTANDLNLGYKHNLYNIRALFDRLKDIDCRISSLCGDQNEGLGGPKYDFRGDCSTTSFALDNEAYGAQTSLGVEDVLVFVNGVFQPNGYTINNSSGTSHVVFDVTPTNTDTITVKVISNARVAYRVVESGIADGSITTGKLANGSVTPSKIGFTGYGTQYQVFANQDGTNWGATSLTPTFVTGFDTQVRTSRLDQMAAPTTNLNANSNKITNLANGTNATDAAAYGQISGMGSSITSVQNNIAGGYNPSYGGVMPDIYFRANYQTTRNSNYSFYAGVVPQVAYSSTRHSTQKLMIGFIPRRIRLLLAGAIRRNGSSTIIHSQTNFSRTYDWVRWDDDNWFTVTNTGTFDGQYKTYNLIPQSTANGDYSLLSNITVQLEIDFTNSNTWLYIFGSGFGSELMRLTSPSDDATPGVIQLIAERGY